MQKHLSLFDTLSRYLIAAVLIIVPLFPKFPLFNVPGSYVAIRSEDLLLLVLAIFTLIKMTKNIKVFINDKIVISFVIFFATGFLTLFTGSFLTQTAAFRVGIFHWARRIEYVVPFFAGLTLLTGEKVSENLNFYLKIILIDTALAFVYGFGQRYFHFPVILTQNEEYSKGVALFWSPGSHINSTFAGHYDLAAYLVLVLPIFIPLMFLVKRWTEKILIFLVSSSGLWLLINSLSRTGQISYLIAVSVAMVLIRRFKGLAVVLAVSIFFIVMSSGVDQRFQRLIYLFTQKVSIGRITGYILPHYTVLADEILIPNQRVAEATPSPTPTPVLEDRSASIRLNVEWPRAIRAFVKNPITGTGYSSIDLATDNDYLRLLGETGILGFVSFWLIFLRIGKVLVEGLSSIYKLPIIEKAFIVGTVGALFGTFLSAFFIDLFEASKFATLFWLVLGYSVYMVRNASYVKEN